MTPAAPAPSSADPRLTAARMVFAYLAETDPLPLTPVDAAIGFGMFDVTLAIHCADLCLRGHARNVVITGGIGAGTGKLGQPEANAWAAALRAVYPDFPADRLILENRSTNTAENIQFTADLLHRDHPGLTLGSGLRTALIVASPSRLRRVGLTLRLLVPALHVVRHLPARSFEHEQALYATQGLDYLDHLAGELDRIVSYPARGWIAAEPLPPAIAAAHAILRR